MKTIRIYIATKLIDKTMAFIALIDNDNSEIYVQTNETSSNRALMIGLRDVLENYPPGSKIEVLSPVNFGFRYLRNDKKWINRDVGSLLKNVIKNNDLNVKFIDYSKSPEYDDMKKLLKRKIGLKYSKNNDNTSFNMIVTEESNIFNPSANDGSFKVNLLVRGIFYLDDDRSGKYISILQCKGKELILRGNDINTTSQRMVLKGIMEAINKLNKPCHIDIYSHDTLGLSLFNKKRKGSNKDLKEDLLNLIKDKNHSIKILNNPNAQTRLIKELK